jgi:hypothetical protein
MTTGVGGKGGDDGVERPLLWSQAVGVCRIEDEVVASILEGETTALWDNSCIVSGNSVSLSGSRVCLDSERPD